MERPAALSAASFLALYDRGDYEEVSRGLEAISEWRDLNRLDGDLRNSAKSWIEAAPAEQRIRRTFVAATFSLDVTRGLIRRKSWLTNQWDDHAANPESLPAMTRLLEGVPRSVDPLYYKWVLAAMATWQEWNAPARMADSLVTPEPAWALLMGQPRLIAHAEVQDAMGPDGFLRRALNRFPDDPRLRLAEAEALEAIQTRCAELFCHDEMTPGAVQDLRRRAGAPGPTNESVGCKDRCWVYGLLRRLHDSAVANLAAFDRLLPVASEFAKLAARYPTIHAEASLHIGYLAIRAGRADAALQPLVTAAASDDPHVAYLGAHFSGRAFEMLDRPTDATAAYRRALEIVPGAASSTTLLAAHLFASDSSTDRAEAHVLLEAARAGASIRPDPWDQYWQGDARLWATYMQQLRETLRQ